MRLYKTGTVLNVNVETLGDALTADAASDATVIVVDDAADFELGDDATGQLLLNDVVYTYIAVDDDTGEITLASGLTADAEDADEVFLYDPLYEIASTEKTADVRLHDVEQGGDPIYATFAQHLVEKLGEGIRGVRGETVLLERDRGEWRIVDVLGFGDPETGAGSTRFKIDSFAVTATGDQTLILTHTPQEDSLHLYWNGLEQDGEYTLDGNVITMVDAADLLQVGDELVAKYAYRPSSNQRNTLAFGSQDWGYLQVAYVDSTDRSGISFDDSGWDIGAAPFSNLSTPYPTVPDVPIGTVDFPLGERIWLRRTFETLPGPYVITVRTDNWAEVYLNGELVDTVGADDDPEAPADSIEYTFNVTLTQRSNVVAINAWDDPASNLPGDSSYIDLQIEPA